MARTEKKAIYPDVSKIQLGAGDWNSRPVFYPRVDIKTGVPILIGRVYKIHGRHWNNGKSFFWSNSIGSFCYSPEDAASELATWYVRNGRPPAYL